MQSPHKLSVKLVVFWLASSQLSGVLGQQGSCSCYCCNGCFDAQLAGSFAVSHRHAGHITCTLFGNILATGHAHAQRADCISRTVTQAALPQAPSF